MADLLTQERRPDPIPTTLRLVALLEEVARAGSPVTPGTLSDTLGLPKPTVHRLLQTAEAEQFVSRDADGRAYGPGRRMRVMAARTLSSQKIRTERRLILQALAREVGETCNLVVPGRAGMIYLERVETHWPLRIQLPVGSQVPFHATASGKLYLASLRPGTLLGVLQALELDPLTQATLVQPTQLQEELARIRDRGYATDLGEFIEGMAAVAVPVCSDGGGLLTCLAIHAPTQRRTLADLETELPRLRAAAATLEALISA